MFQMAVKWLRVIEALIFFEFSEKRLFFELKVFLTYFIDYLFDSCKMIFFHPLVCRWVIEINLTLSDRKDF